MKSQQIEDISKYMLLCRTEWHNYQIESSAVNALCHAGLRLYKNDVGSFEYFITLIFHSGYS